MREILFRGKRLDNGEWYYGSYLILRLPDCDWTGKTRGQAEDVHYIVNQGDVNYAVDPATAGQYTGQKDKNGKRLFDGDIVQKIHTEDGRDVKGLVEWDNESASFIISTSQGPDDFCISRAASFEKIGNRWDNPELLFKEVGDGAEGPDA